MKKILSFLLLLLSLTSHAQVVKQVKFDFTSPANLNLPTALDTEITTYTCTLGNISISFEKGAILTGVHYYQSGSIYLLKIATSCKMHITGLNDAAIKSVSFEALNLGDLTVVSGQAGDWDELAEVWNCGNDNSINKVSFKDNGTAAVIKSIIVTYSDATDVLTPSPYQQNINVSSFKDLKINFSSSMKRVGTQAINMVNSSNSYPLSVSVNNSVVTLSSTKTITTDGTYTLSIPAGYFQNAEGYRNKALTYTIVVNTPKNTLNYVSVNPTEGEIEKLTSPIMLSFGENLKNFSAEVMMYKDGMEFSPVTIARSADNGEVAMLSFDIPQGISEKGIYTIKVPEKTIYNLLGKIYNPAFTLTYKVGYKPVPVDSETMKKAKALLKKSGVGYPAANSESRTTLTALTTAEEIPTDETLQKAIDAFYSETNVEIPTLGNWYYISNVGATGSPLYVTAKNNELGLTTDKSKATAFEVVEPMLFKTVNGKYLFTGGIEDNADNKTMTLAKMAVAGVNAEKLFGYFSIFGYYKTNKSGEIKNAYASIDRSNMIVSTDDDDNAPVFNDTYSGAFAFTATTKPSEQPIAIDMTCTVSPATVTDANTTLTLTFTDANTISINSQTEAKLCTEEGTTIQSLDLRVNETLANALTVNVGNLQDAKYKILIPAGYVSYTSEGTKYVNNELQVMFEVKKGGTVDPTPSAEFNYTYAGFLYYPADDKVKDVDLNKFTIGNAHYNYPEEPQGLMVDETKEILLVKEFSGDVIRRGHFKKVASIPTDPYSPEAYQIEFDTPIVEGELRAGTYIFVIPKATYGDYNFGKYLKNPSSVKASDCYVNTEDRFSFSVDNTATGIHGVTTGDNVEKKIYTLQGIRVSKMTTPGIYIVNGKKVVKRRE